MQIDPAWTPWLVGYFIVGAVLLSAIYVTHRLSQSRPSAWAQAAMEAANPERRTRRYKILANLVAPALAALFILAVWPVALIMAAKWALDSRNQRRFEAEREERKKRPPVEHSELRARMTLAEVEDREMVDDPLGAVPLVPFGHLFPAWQRFKSQLTDGDEIWVFEAEREDDWSQTVVSSGYAAVRNGRVIAHFTTRRERFD